MTERGQAADEGPAPDTGLAPEVGPVPDIRRQLFDAGLQPERTALAWRRTALALTAAALVSVRILPEILGVWSAVPAGLAVAVAVAVLIAAHRRHQIVHCTLVEADTDRVPLPSGVLPLAVATFVVIGGVAALLVVATGGMR